MTSCGAPVTTPASPTANLKCIKQTTISLCLMRANWCMITAATHLAAVKNGAVGDPAARWGLVDWLERPLLMV